MKLSTRSRYGVRLMLSLALRESDAPVFLKEIARSEEISEKYLSQIIIPLKATGLVTTFRGAHGGYILAMPPSAITLYDIVAPLEGGIAPVDCAENADLCGRSARCVTRDVWAGLAAVITGYLKGITLQMLAEKWRKRNCPARGTDFII